MEKNVRTVPPLRMRVHVMLLNYTQLTALHVFTETNFIREVLKPDGFMLSACPVCQGQQNSEN